MNRRDFLCGAGCLLAGFALSELNHFISYKKGEREDENSPFIGFGIAMASHCNLSCKGCDVFAPLAKPEFTTYDQLTKDFTKLKELYGNPQSIDVSYVGGEPLLNPEFKKIIKKVKELFPHGSKKILTNGTLLNSMDDEFWKLSKECIDDFIITHYPINIERESYEKKAKKFGVKIRYDIPTSNKLFDKETKEIIDENYNQEGFPWSKNILDITGRQPYEDKIYTCPHRGISIYARGNLYYCYVHAHINAFSEYFNLNIPVTKDDYIRIQDIQDPIEIHNFMNTPKPLCRFCKQCHNTCYGGEPLEWDFSKKEITEWT